MELELVPVLYASMKGGGLTDCVTTLSTTLFKTQYCTELDYKRSSSLTLFLDSILLLLLILLSIQRYVSKYLNLA